MRGVRSVAVHATIVGWLMCSSAFSQSTTRVVVDGWFNSQQRMNAAGQEEYFHYKWNDVTNSGFYLFGQIFRGFGATTDTIYAAPTAAGLKDAQIYIIVSPDIPQKNPHPHYVQPEDAQQIAQWVKGGGVLLLMGNDPANSVVDKYGRTHDIANLFICDGSIMPTQGSANPGLTIQALAARTADYLISQGESVFNSDKRGMQRPPVRHSLSPSATWATVLRG